MASTGKELGRFLRSLREGISPETVGLSGGGRRRTPGLRREELAHLSGISSTWYSWIEQGRPVSVSAGVLDRLASTLRMTLAQRQYLFDLAGKHSSGPPDLRETEEIPLPIPEFVLNQTGPSYLLNTSWDAILWNKPAEELFWGWLSPGAKSRNLLEYMFLEPAARSLVIDWEDRARRLIADFRADCATKFEEPPFSRILDSLHSGSPEFRKFWQTREVSWREGGRKLFRHPTLGLLEYRQVTFLPVIRRDLKLTVLVHEGTTPL